MKEVEAGKKLHSRLQERPNKEPAAKLKHKGESGMKKDPFPTRILQQQKGQQKREQLKQEDAAHRDAAGVKGEKEQSFQENTGLQ